MYISIPDTFIPTRSLFFSSMPCEVKCAKIRIKSFHAIRCTGDIAEVSYRYLQTRTGEINTRCEALFYITIFSMCLLSLLVNTMGRKSHNETKLSTFQYTTYFLALLMNGLHVPPNIANYRNYRDTKESCQIYLEEILEPSIFKEVKNLDFNQAGLSVLKDILDNQGIDTNFLASRDRLFSTNCCWDLDR
jgi:hypothetical protein